MSTDHHLSPEDRPLPTEVGLCDPIPDDAFYCLDCEHAWHGAGHRGECQECGNPDCRKADRRRIVIDGVREPWSDEDRALFKRAHEDAQPGRFAA